MATAPFGMSPPTKLEAAAPTPAAAPVADTRSAQTPFAAVGSAPLTCRTVQKKVHAAEQSLGAAQARLRELAAKQDEAVDAAIDQALAQLDQLHAAVREARRTREALAQTWAAAVAAFRLTRRGSNR